MNPSSVLCIESNMQGIERSPNQEKEAFSLGRKWCDASSWTKAGIILGIAGAIILTIGLTIATTVLPLIVIGALLLGGSMACFLTQKEPDLDEPENSLKADPEFQKAVTAGTGLVKKFLQPEVIDPKKVDISKEQIQAFSNYDNYLRKGVNTRQLLKLKNQLIEALGHDRSARELVKNTLSRWEKTVSEMDKKGEILSNSTLTEIIRAITADQRQLDKIENAIAQGRLGLSDEGIHKRINEHLKTLNEPYSEIFLTRLRHQINKIYLDRIIHDKGAFLASNDEIHMLEALDYSLKIFQEKDMVHAIIAEQILNIQEEVGFGDKTLKELRSRVKREAYFQRLNVLEESEDCALKLHHALVIWKKLKKYGFALVNPLLQSLFEKDLQGISKMEQSKTYFILSVNAGCRKICRDKLTDYYRKNKPHIRGILKYRTLKQYKNEIEISIASNFNDTVNLLNLYKAKINALIKRDLVYLKKWNEYFSANVIQGFMDKDATFQQGVCWGYAHRVAALDQHNPDADNDAHLNARDILPKDRILQNIQTCSGLNGNLDEDKKKNIAHRNNFEDYRNFDPIVTDESEALDPTPRVKNLCTSLEKEIRDLSVKGSLDDSEGVLHFSFRFKTGSGHAIYIRYDAKRGIYRYVDANIGVFTLRADKDLCTDNELQEKFFTFLNETILCKYKDLIKILPYQLILPKN